MKSRRIPVIRNHEKLRGARVLVSTSAHWNTYGISGGFNQRGDKTMLNYGVEKYTYTDPTVGMYYFRGRGYAVKK